MGLREELPRLLKDLNKSFYYNHNITFSPIILKPDDFVPYRYVVVDGKKTPITFSIEFLLDMQAKSVSDPYNELFWLLFHQLRVYLGYDSQDSDPVEQVLINIKKEIYG